MIWEREGGYSLTQKLLDILHARRLRHRTAGCAGDLRLFAAGLVVRLPLPESEKIGFCWPSWRACPAWRSAIWPSSGQTVLTVHSYFGSAGWYFVPGVPDDGANHSSAMLCRHSLRSPFHRAEVAPHGSVSEPGHCRCRRGLPGLQRRISPLRSSLLTGRVGQPSARMGSLLLIWVCRSWTACSRGKCGRVVGCRRHRYFSRYPVVNLDGLVNSYEYLRAKGKEPRPRSTSC